MNDPQEGGGIGLMLGAFATLGEQSAQQHDTLLRKLERPLPVRRVLIGSVLTGGSGTDLLTASNQSQMGPSQGRMWVVRKIVLSPVPSTATVTGVTADIYVGASADVIGTDFEAIEAFGVTLPYVNTWGNRHVCAYPGETAYAILHGEASPNIQFVMALECDEYRIGEVESMHV